MDKIQISHVRETVDGQVLGYLPAQAIPTATTVLTQGDYCKVLVEGALIEDPGGDGYMLEIFRTKLSR